MHTSWIYPKTYFHLFYKPLYHIYKRTKLAYIFTHQTEKTQRIKGSVPRLVSCIESNMSSHWMSQRGTCRRGDTPSAPTESTNLEKSFQNVICVNWRTLSSKVYSSKLHHKKKRRTDECLLGLIWNNEIIKSNVMTFSPPGSRSPMRMPDRLHIKETAEGGVRMIDSCEESWREWEHHPASNWWLESSCFHLISANWVFQTAEPTLNVLDYVSMQEIQTPSPNVWIYWTLDKMIKNPFKFRPFCVHTVASACLEIKGTCREGKAPDTCNIIRCIIDFVMLFCAWCLAVFVEIDSKNLVDSSKGYRLDPS